MPLDIRVVELVAARLCHDLVSPVGAIRNGLELIEEMEDEPGGGFFGEAIKLIDHSSEQANRRLRLFRLAYGLAGREQKGFGECREAVRGWVEGGRTGLNWPAGVPDDQLAFRRGLAKALTNVIVLADEALTHGGTITVSGGGTETMGALTVAAEGRPGALKPEAAAALAGTLPVAELTPRGVHAYLTGRFAEDDGYRVTATPAGPDRLLFGIAW